MPSDVNGSTTSRIATALGGIVGSLMSFRVLVALSTSVAVTGAVSGPLAYQVANNREVVADTTTTTTTEGPTTTRAPVVPTPPTEAPDTTKAPSTTTSTTTTTTSTTTTTTLPRVTLAPSTTTQTTQPEPSADGIMVSTASDHSDGTALNGAVAIGGVYFYFDEPAASIDFYLDSPVDGSPDRTDTSAPFDFAVDDEGMAVPFDTEKLSVGLHTLIAVAKGGQEPERRIAVFTNDEKVLKDRLDP